MSIKKIKIFSLILLLAGIIKYDVSLNGQEKYLIRQEITFSQDSNFISNEIIENNTDSLDDGIYLHDENDQAFQPVAEVLVISLITRVNLSQEQMEAIEEILVEYNSNIRETKNGFYGDKEESLLELNDLIGNITNYSKLVETYSIIDQETNYEIEHVLNEDQIKQYLDYKSAWWKEVKERIYSSEDIDDNFKIDQFK